jgi:D-methionine transport system ATP-binding protein
VLEVKDLNLIYNQKLHVLKNINFEVKKGEVAGIIGLSGAGKTSILRSLVLLEKPTSGEIKLNGKDLSKLKERDLMIERKKISVVFQNYNLLSTRTVYENIALPLEINKEKNIKDRVLKLAEEVGLKDRLDHYPSSLSGGEKQRTAIARGMINNPEILLLDEPTSALDPNTTDRILKLVLDLNKKHDLSTIIVTHEMDVIKRACDRVVYLKNGEVNFFGPVYKFFIEKEKEIYEEFYKEINIDWKAARKKSGKENQKLIKVTFYGDSTHEPILDEISKKYDVKLNYIYGKIEHLKLKPYGTLIIVVEYEDRDIEGFMKELESKVYKLEELL